MKYYIVLDLEMCQVPSSLKKYVGKSTETIQFGAVLLDESYRELSSFNRFVKPQYGILDERISRMTGIKEENLANADLFEAVLTELVSWIPEGEVTLISWSMSDKVQLMKEMAGKKIVNERMQSFFEGWMDSQELFSKKIGNARRYNLEEALNLADIQVQGHVHDGYSDALNTAHLFTKMMTQTQMKWNSYYLNAKTEVEHLSVSMGELFKNLKLEDGDA